MMGDLLRAPELTAGAGEAAAALLLAGCLLLLRHLLSQAPVAALLGSGEPGEGPFRWPLQGGPRLVGVHRLLAAVLLGAPATGAALVLFGPGGLAALAGPGARAGAALAAGAATAAVLASFMALISRQPGICERYPAMRAERWTIGVALLDAGTWTVYLASHELLMRGLLLGVLAAAIGPLPALAATVLVDALAHVPQGRPESLGSACSAVLFGALALATGGILAPFIAHLAMAVSVDLCCARRRAAVARVVGGDGRR